MTRIAISGHCALPTDTVALVEPALRVELADHGPDLVGVT